MKSMPFVISILTLLFISCNDNSKDETTFKINIKEPKKSYKSNETLTVSLENTQNKKTDSVVFYIDENRLGKTAVDKPFSFSLENQKLGNRILHAKVYLDKKTETPSKDLYILASERPKLYGYKIINTYPHDIEAYTQGLEFHGDYLYEGTGQYGKSSLRKTNYKTGEVLKQIDLDKAYFGEGITILNNKIYQLTWRENTGFIYNLETLEKTGSFVYSKSNEGWGLCNDGETIYKSDGTEKIWTLNKDNLTEESYIEIYTNTSRIKSVNELEWVEGRIYANIFQKNAIAIINPKNGAVEGVIDLSDLQSKVKQHQFLDVLNGVAYKGDKNRLIVTGKNWDSLFEIEIFEK
ncbi:MAG: glutaminyl-peptide cyclotransferase [Flavobacteriaceae bacterium]